MPSSPEKSSSNNSPQTPESSRLTQEQQTAEINALITKYEGIISKAAAINKPAIVDEYTFKLDNARNKLAEISGAEVNLDNLFGEEPASAATTAAPKLSDTQLSQKYDVVTKSVEKKPWEDTADMDGGLGSNDIRVNRRMGN